MTLFTPWRDILTVRLLALSVVSLTVACDDDPSAETGGLWVMLESDLAIPKDIDRVKLEVRQGEALLRSEEHAIGQDQLRIPAQFRLGPMGNRAPVLIKGTAFKRDESRIERSAITPIPAVHEGLLRLPLNYLCKGFIDGFGSSSCGMGMTCDQGRCVESMIPASKLPRYEWEETETTASGVRAGGDSAGGAALVRGALRDECFDVLSCFASFRIIDVPAPQCSFELPIGSDPERLNIALSLPPGSDGICDVEGCWVALDRGASGWTLDGDRITLPPMVCAERPDGLPFAIAVSSACSAKTSDTPPCGSWSSATVPIHAEAATDLPPPAIGDSCAGRASERCGQCGTRTRSCRNGVWSEWSECSAEGECAAGATQACGNGGLQVCNASCGWDECLGQSCADGPATRACGHCGSQTRSCDNGAWSEWGPCSDEGECAPDEVRGCENGGTQVCGGNCSYGECTQQVCPGAASAACGRCGTRTRSCDADSGTWSEWSECANEGECEPDSTQSCGSAGTQVCGGDCSWDEQCAGQQCDGPLARECGSCGTQTRQCDSSTGQETEWSECTNEGACTAGMTRACGGGNGLQTCGDDCRWGSECVTVCDGPFTQRCGMCGTQSRGCDLEAGTEGEWSACSGEGACMPGATRSCGNGGRQTCGRDCQWPAECDCSSTAIETRSCGLCGVQTRSRCTATGPEDGWSECMNEGVCAPGDVEACGDARSRVCGAQCQWGRCEFDCTGVALTQACGACGMQTRSCGPNGPSEWGACIGQGECTPGTTQACGGVEAEGVQTCGQTCRWGRCGCAAPLQACGGSGCVDLSSDPDHCGECDNDCGGVAVCIRGRCRCGEPNLTCGDECVDPMSDARHCGGCDRECPPSMTCNGGQCGCADGTVPVPGAGCQRACDDGQSLCGGECVDLRSDPNHCSRCDVGCAAGGTCSNGQCTCPRGFFACGRRCIQVGTLCGIIIN